MNKTSYIIFIQVLLLISCSICLAKNLKREKNQQQVMQMFESFLEAKVKEAVDYSYQLTLGTSEPRFIPNVDFVGQGYNIFYGNPHSTVGLDPGYKNFRIAAIEYPATGQDSLSADRQYLQPFGTRVLTHQSCSISFSSKSVSSLQNYKDSLQLGASIGGSYAGAAFSASADYQSVRSGLQSASSIFIESGAQCVTFQVGLQQADNFQPNISSQFGEAMRELEALGENESAFHDIFDKIGTHVTEELKLGSLFGYRFELSTKEVQNLVNQRVNVEASASYLAASAKVKTSFEKENEDKFKSALTNWRSFSIGALPNENNDPAVWATQTVSNPMPVYASLISLPDFLTTYNKKNKITLKDPKAFTARMSKYLGTYCENRLKLIGKVPTCAAEDIKAPISAMGAPQTFYDRFANGQTPIAITYMKSARVWGWHEGERKVKVQTNRGQNYQQWVLTKVGTIDNIYTIKSMYNNQCMTPTRCDNSYGSLTLTNCNPNDQCQQFRLSVLNESRQFVKIANVRTGYTINTEGTWESEGSNLQVYTDQDENLIRMRFSFA